MTSNYDLRDLRVLIVDDNHFMLQILSNILRTFNIRHVQTASDGADALTALRSMFSPDIILTAWDMDVLDGIELTRIIRNSIDSRDPYVAVIMVTARTRMRCVEEARDAGVTEFLAKPISASTLHARICSVIERPREFIKTKTFFGPDRRRSTATETTNMGRRKGDFKTCQPAAEDAAILSQLS